MARRSRTLGWIAALGLAAAALALWRRPERLTPLIRALDRRLESFAPLPSYLYDLTVAPLLQPFYHSVAQDVARALPAGRVLDVASGPGHLAVHIARLAPGAHVVSLDISPTMVLLAARHAQQAGLQERVHAVCADAHRLPFRDGSFDLVVSTLGVHHWRSPSEALAEIYRVLRPDGESWNYDARLVGLSAQEVQEVVAGTPFPVRSLRYESAPGPGLLRQALTVWRVRKPAP